MTKEVQIRGGPFDTVKDVVYLPRELAVDESNHDLLIGDGTTPGGRRILSEANADEKYQLASPELLGFTEFQPQDKGLLVRLGPASYALRGVVAANGSLTVTNPRGQGGNITIKLADDVVTDHTWSGVQTFTSAIEAEGGINGDLAGNTTGTHTGNVVGNVTGNLLGDSQGTHTGPSIGAIDARGEAFLLDDGSIPLEYLGPDVIAYIVGLGNQPGFIQMWSGSIVSIPEGWFLCDGNNGTPDLRGRFVLGAGGGVDPDQVGGTATHQHTFTTSSAGAHVHTATAAGVALTEAQMPAHRHANGVTDSGTNVFNRGNLAAVPTTPDSIDNNSNDGTIEGYTSTVGGGATHTHGITVDSDGAHTHAGTVDSNSNVPPYYALAYIMKGP